MTSEHIEVERKFEADEGFSLPDLTGVGEVAAVGDPEAQSLEAWPAYFRAESDKWRDFVRDRNIRVQ